MLDPPTTGSHAEAVRVLTGMLPMLDSANPNNWAFKQVSIMFVFVAYLLPPKLYFPQPDTHFVFPYMMQCIVYSTLVAVASECSGATCTRQGMYKRIA
jgi:hypothetical protein